MRSVLAGAAALLCLLAAAPAHASVTVTIENFVDAGGAEADQPFGARALKVDVEGNGVDAHSGSIGFFEGRYRRYGESYFCPFTFDSAAQLFNPTRRSPPPCGFRSYSSTDLVHWRDDGPLIPDLPKIAVDERHPAGGGNGYFAAEVLHDPERDRYVLWFNAVRRGGDDRPAYFTAVSKDPAGPFEDLRPVPLASPQGGDFDVFVDRDGSAYMVHVVASPPFEIRGERLKPGLREGVGTETRLVELRPDPDCSDRLGCTVGTHESPILFRRGERYYLMTGEACAYCASSAGYYVGTSPAGPFTGATGMSSRTDRTIKAHPRSCGGQPRRVDVLEGPDGPIYLLQVDLWNSDEVNAGSGGFGYPQQGLAGYYWTPLAFGDDGRIEPLRCELEVTLRLARGSDGTPRPDPDADVRPPRTGLRASCVAEPGATASQGLVAGRRGRLLDVRLPVFGYDAPDGSLELTVVREGADDALASTAVPAADVPFSPTVRRLAVGAPVAAGDRFELRLRHTGSRGCYGTAVSARDAIAGTATTTTGGVADLAVGTRVGRPRLAVSVRPRVVRAGRRTRVTVRVRVRDGAVARPAARARVRILGRTVRTGRRGRARVVVRPARAARCAPRSPGTAPRARP
jgi:hypothetical protein